MTATLAEPVVLAAAKEALYPDVAGQSHRYAVTDTQFAVESWGGWTVPASVRERLQPFNTIRLTSGEPDLLGVGVPEHDVLDCEAGGPPVVAVEAKGHNTTPVKADVTRGIEQAHARLSEVNLGLVAAPAESVTDTARALARELNIGVLGVRDPTTVEVVEPARITGAGEFSRGIEAIRFQASTHQLTEGSFPVNHPKNYLGYALAVAAPQDTEAAYTDHVINDVSAGRRGAILLGLVDAGGEDDELTHLGADVVRVAKQHHGSVPAALDTFATWKRKRTRFTDLAPQWAQVARAVTMQYEPTKLVVDALEHLHGDGHREVSLPDLVARACEVNQPLAVEIFITADKRDAVLTTDGDLNPSRLDDPTVYKSGAYFQFKAQLYHVGLLTAGGTDDGEAALSDVWRLEHPVA